MIHFVLLISRQGKVRLTKWYSPYNAKDKARAVREVSATVLARQQKQCNFLEYKDKKIIYKRYASLYFLACVDEEDNELIVLETIHHFVEVRDQWPIPDARPLTNAKRQRAQMHVHGTRCPPLARCTFAVP